MGDSYGSSNKNDSCCNRGNNTKLFNQGVIFGEIVLSDSGATMGTPLIMAILT